MSNYGLIRFIRFVSRFTGKLYNAFFISSRFKSPCRCRKKILELWIWELNTGYLHLGFQSQDASTLLPSTPALHIYLVAPRTSLPLHLPPPSLVVLLVACCQGLTVASAWKGWRASRGSRSRRLSRSSIRTAMVCCLSSLLSMALLASWFGLVLVLEFVSLFTLARV